MQATTLKQENAKQILYAGIDRGTALQIVGGLAGWAALMGYLFLLPGLLGQLMQPIMGA